MKQPILYLMLGYPGAGKTTAAKAIHNVTGAVHIWADKIRYERFGTPTYSHEENLALYEHLNEVVAELLATGQSVVFDTAFNFYKDRKHLENIAAEHNTKTLLVWVKTAKEIAKDRATQDDNQQKTRILGNMSVDHFDALTEKLEEPQEDERFITLNGTKITDEYVLGVLQTQTQSE